MDGWVEKKNKPSWCCRYVKIENMSLIFDEAPEKTHRVGLTEVQQKVQ